MSQSSVLEPDPDGGPSQGHHLAPVGSSCQAPGCWATSTLPGSGNVHLPTLSTCPPCLSTLWPFPPQAPGKPHPYFHNAPYVSMGLGPWTGVCLFYQSGSCLLCCLPDPGHRAGLEEVAGTQLGYLSSQEGQEPPSLARLSTGLPWQASLPPLHWFRTSLRTALV